MLATFVQTISFNAKRCLRPLSKSCIVDPSVLHPELSFRTSRSSGSGGQHVNKVESRVELLFDIRGSAALTEAQKALLFERLDKRINKDGTLLIARQNHRSQRRNREAALAAFDELVTKALRPRKRRKKVKPLVAGKQKRLKNKKQRSEKKAMRRKVDY